MGRRRECWEMVVKRMVECQSKKVVTREVLMKGVASPKVRLK